MDYLLGFIIGIGLSVIGYNLFSVWKYNRGEWETIVTGDMKVTTGSPLTGHFSDEHALVYVEENTKTGKRRGFIETLDGSTHKLGKAHVIKMLKDSGIE